MALLPMREECGANGDDAAAKTGDQSRASAQQRWKDLLNEAIGRSPGYPHAAQQRDVDDATQQRHFRVDVAVDQATDDDDEIENAEADVPWNDDRSSSLEMA